MKRFLVALLVVLSLLLITPTVYGQVNVTPEVISAKCNPDGCIMLWKVTIQNETNISIKGNLIVMVMDENKNMITHFNMGPVTIKGLEFKVLAGTILLENSERTKTARYLTATIIDIVQFIPINTIPFLKF